MNQETIITAVASIAGTLSMLLLKEYISAIFKTYPPDIKKHISLMKKSFSFALRYIFPIAAILILMIVTANVTKFFVLAVVINVAALIANGLFELYFGLQDSVELHVMTLTNQDRIISVMQKNADIVAEHSSFIRSLAETQGQLAAELKRLKGSN